MGTGATIQPNRKVEFLDVDLIEVHERFRVVKDDAVETLAASLEKIGLRTPVSVRYYSERPDDLLGDTDDALVLMTGAHRLAAAKQLGWEKIECFVYYDGDRIDAQLWEIAENLHRADLSKEERDRQIKRYAELLKEREVDLQSRQSAPIESKREDGRGHRPEGIASRIAKETGLSKSTINRVLSDKPQPSPAQREERKARQAEFDRQRDENRAKLPDAIKEREEIKQRGAALPPATKSREEADRQWQARAAEAKENEHLRDRVAELEDAVRVLEEENTALKAENKKFSEMKAEWEKGGFEEVVRGKDEVIHAQATRIEAESRDKASWMRSAKWWKEQAISHGYSDRQVIDIETGEVAGG